MKKILSLPRYTAKGPSSRVRIYQYLPSLREAGFDINVQPFFDDAYIDALFRGKKKSMAGISESYIHRISASLKSSPYDLIWMQYELLPWLPYGLERLFLSGSTKLAIDYDDAIFHRYDAHPSPIMRALLGKKIDRWMHKADWVIAGNDYLAQHALAARAQHVEILPSVVDANRYAPKSLEKAKRHTIRIGWIGSPKTVHYLLKIKPAIQAIVDQGHNFVIIGAEIPPALQFAGVETLPWSLGNEVQFIRELDIGVMPLPDQAFERGKCGYKLIQYMACGIPVVASPVGVNQKIVQSGKNGFFAGNIAEWQEALNKLAQSSSLRQKLGRNGRKLVESEYSLQTAAPKLIDYFNQLI